MTDDRPSIAELQRIEREHPDHPTHAVLLEIAAAAREHLRILDDPMSGHRAVESSRSALREALSKVRP